MQRLAIFVLIAAWFTASTAAATPRSPYSDFPPDAGHQARLDYLNGLDMIKVESGDELQQAIEAIPVEADIDITPEQEADLRAWLYDFLVAFSVSGSDSLAAKFYLRGGINPEGIADIKRQLEAIKLGDPLTAQHLQAMGIQIPELPIDATPWWKSARPPAGMGIQMPELPIAATPFDLFKAIHRFGINIKRHDSRINRRDYFFGNASFFTSAYRVFELQGDYYESYRDYAQTHGLIPMKSMEWSPELRGQIEEGLKLGGQWVAAEFMFIVEEPEEFVGFGRPPMRHPFFVRLVWNPRQAMWRLVEAFAPNDAPVLFLFNAT